jgi:hypothetical protein
MASDYREEKRAGLKQALAAWAVLLAVMAAVQFAHLLWHGENPFQTTRTTIRP